MEFTNLVERAEQIKELYAHQNVRRGRPEWGATEYTQGLVADVGDLMKLMMAKDGLRGTDDVDKKIRHELVDCLWSILIIAREVDIDLEAAFAEEMTTLEQRITADIG